MREMDLALAIFLGLYVPHNSSSHLSNVKAVDRMASAVEHQDVIVIPLLSLSLSSCCGNGCLTLASHGGLASGDGDQTSI